MNRLQTLTALIVLWYIAFGLTAHAQTDIGELQPGSPVERTMTTDETHRYKINLKENQHLDLVVDQRGIDVVVKVFDPEGKSLGAVDTPNGVQGPEAISIVTEASGAHRIEIQPYSQQEGGASSGRYTVRVLSVREATQEEIELSRARRSMQPKALELLGEVAVQGQNFKLAINRATILTQAADLLWEHDEERARTLFAEAIAALSVKKSVRTDSDEHGNDPLSSLRQQTLQTIARRDPQLAIDLLPVDGGLGADAAARASSENSQMELSLALSVASNNPRKALEIAERSLNQGVSYQLLNLLGRLKEKDSEIASKLAASIIKKLLTADLAADAQAGQLAINLLQQTAEPRQAVATSTAEADKKSSPLLTEQQLRDLAEKVTTAAQNAPANREMLMSLQPLMPTLEKYVPTRAASLRRKSDELTRRVTELQRLINPEAERWQATEQELTQASESGTVEALNAVAAKVPAEMQSYIYAQAARQAISRGELERARQIIKDKVSDSHLREDLMSQVERQVVELSLKQGEVDKTRKLLLALDKPEERAVILARLAVNVAGIGNKELAKQLLNEARSLIGNQAANSAQLNTQLWVARLGADIDPSMAYEMLGTAVDRLNELTAAAVVLDGFLPQGASFEDGEMLLRNNSFSSTLFQPFTTLLAALARVNFDRTRAIADRIQRPEMRALAHLQLTEGVLRPQGVTSSDASFSPEIGMLR